MPLVWAHAEYIKLLRSTADGQPFDLIPIVAERYQTRTGRKDLEVWKPTRQVRHVAQGHVLRLQAPQSFQLHWSMDEWHTVYDSESEETSLGIYFVDLPTTVASQMPIRFTFFWIAEQQWEGHDYAVDICQLESAAENSVATLSCCAGK